MRRLLKLFAYLLLFLVIAAAIAYPIVKSRVRASIEQRCAATFGVACTIDDLALHTDGASANGVHLRGAASLVSGDIESIAVRFDWVRLLRGQAQDVSVHVTKPQLTDDVPIGDIALKLGRMHRGLAPDGSVSNLTLTELTADGGDVRVQVTLLADVHVQQIALDWKVARPLELRWSDASFDAMLTSQSTGPCTLRLTPESPKVEATCGKRKFSFDVEKVRSLSDLAKLFALDLSPH